MINLAEIVNDPDFAQAFTITRSNGQFVAGGWQNQTSTVPAYGVIQPATSKDLEQIPEGDRVAGMMAFHSVSEMRVTDLTPAGVSDIIFWNGDRWRIQYVFQWQDFGYYKALGVRMSGA